MIFQNIHAIPKCTVQFKRKVGDTSKRWDRLIVSEDICMGFSECIDSYHLKLNYSQNACTIPKSKCYLKVLVLQLGAGVQESSRHLANAPRLLWIGCESDLACLMGNYCLLPAPESEPQTICHLGLACLMGNYCLLPAPEFEPQTTWV